MSKLIMTRRDPTKETVEQRIMAMQVCTHPCSEPSTWSGVTTPQKPLSNPLL